MSRRVLLIEPNYKNKYPPLSLMKLSTYHRMIGDEVTFYKGTEKQFALNETMNLLLGKLHENDANVEWNRYWEDIAAYLTKGKEADFKRLAALSNNPWVAMNLKSFRKYFRTKGYLDNPQWDRVCITTLFTFYWDITIDAINYFKKFCKDSSEVFVGGIAASVVPDEMEKETGIRPIVGLLDKGGELDPEHKDIVIEYLALDYSILEEIDYVYPEHDGYYGYMTRGCVNHCAFCVVPKLEPTYQEHIPIAEKITKTKERFGDKRNLLLLDNNVLASNEFDSIIEEIKAAGFRKNAHYVAPNAYEIAIENVRNGYNVPAYMKNLVKQYRLLIKKEKNSEQQEWLKQKIHDEGLDNIHTITQEKIFAMHSALKDSFAKIYQNKPKARYVDFNQGIDSRLMTEEKVKKLAEIPIRPLRVAFDHWELRDKYRHAIELAAKYGIRHLSNYLLYNFKDRPIELYYRMKMNVELCEEYDLDIYSFPMKYHPITDPKYFRNRLYLGEYWNRKFIRAIQAVLNSTKGKIGRGQSFFEKAFGKNEEEFDRLLYMPEVMIVYRNRFEENRMVFDWYEDFMRLPQEKRDTLKQIVGDNEFSNISTLTDDVDILHVLEYYAITRGDIEREDAEKE